MLNTRDKHTQRSTLGGKPGPNTDAARMARLHWFREGGGDRSKASGNLLYIAARYRRDQLTVFPNVYLRVWVCLCVWKLFVKRLVALPALPMFESRPSPNVLPAMRQCTCI